MAYISFAELKDRVPIMDVVKWLDIELKQSKEQWRGPCPICEKDDPRVFVVTPAKKAWYCFNCSDGGDCIKLVANLQRIGTKEAAERINAAFPGTSRTSSPSGERTGSTATASKRQQSGEPFDLDKHKQNLEKIKARLVYTGEVMEALGQTEEVYRATGIGYDPRQKRILFPIYVGGEHVDYTAFATEGDQAPLILFYKNLAQICAAPIQEQTPQQGSDVRSFLRVVK